MKNFKVNIGYTTAGRERNRYFETLEAAKAFCERVFAASNIILSIERVNERVAS